VFSSSNESSSYMCLVGAFNRLPLIVCVGYK